MNKKILFVGESWTSYGIHIKGFNYYTTGSYDEGGNFLLNVLGANNQVTYIRNHEVVSKFPNQIEELKKYDVIILSDVGSDTFLLHPDTLVNFKVRANPLQLIADFVSSGKGFLMIGGFMSYCGFEGKANYINTKIADVLPVELLGRDDRIETPESATPKIISNHPILTDLDKWPHFLGYNRLISKPATQVLLQVNSDPFLTLGSYGKGRTAAFASDCAPHWGSPEFLNWEGYPIFWNRLIDWLAFQKI